ncbi:MAG: FliG C-terminal domain-containing protein [Elusimicrobiota bacterium]
MRSALAALLLLCLPGPRARAAAAPDTWQTFRSMEERVETLLSDMLGPGRARVFIRASASPSAARHAAPAAAPLSDPEEARPGELFERLRGLRERSPEILPGYGLPRSLREELLLLYADARTAAPAQKEPAPVAMTIKLVLDPKVPDAQVQPILNTLSDILDLSPESGDEVRVLRAPFKPRLPPASMPDLRWTLLAGLGLLPAALVLLAALPLIMRLRPEFALLRPRMTAGSLRDLPLLRSERERRLRTPLSPLRGHPESRRGFLRGNSALFDVLRAARLRLGLREAQKTAEFLSNEPPPEAAKALRRFEPAAAAAVFRRLPSMVREAVSLELARNLSMPPPEPTPLPRSRWRRPPPPPPPPSLRERLTRYLRRTQRERFLEELAIRLSSEEREELASRLATSAPERADALRRLPSLESLASADAHSLRECLARFPASMLAEALFGLDENSRAGLLKALPLPLAQIVQEDCRKVHPAPDRLGELRGEILSRWLNLADRGRITPQGDLS